MIGAHETPLRVMKGSHGFIFLMLEEKLELDAGFPLEKITIPPYSIFVGRSDLTRAGAAAEDAEEEESVDCENDRLVVKLWRSLARYSGHTVRETIPLTYSQ